MKQIAVLKIIAWSIVVVVLIGVLAAVSMGEDLTNRIPSLKVNLSNVFNNAKGDVEVLSVQTLSVENIESIDIKWVSGTFKILPTDGEQIVITQKANRELDKEEMLKIIEEGNRLEISQGRIRGGIFFFGFGGVKIVNELKLPSKHYGKINANFKSGRLLLEDIKTTRFKTNMTSGRVQSSGLIAEHLILETISGSLDLAGEFSQIDAKVVSGSVKVDTYAVPDRIDIDLISGKAVVKIPDNDGFRLSKDKLAGRVNSEFKTDDFGVYKDGSAEYRVKVVSGKVEILKNPYPITKIDILK